MSDRPDSNAPGSRQPAPVRLSRRGFLQAAGLAGAGLAVGVPDAAKRLSAGIRDEAGIYPSDFVVAFDDGGLTSLKRTEDTDYIEYIDPGHRLGDLIVRYRRGSEAWKVLDTAKAKELRSAVTSEDGLEHETTIRSAPGSGTPEVRVGFKVGDHAVDWTLTLRNPTDTPLQIGDLAIPLPVNRNRSRNNETTQGKKKRPPILKHGLVSGHGSFFFWMRGDLVRPHLMLTPRKDTSLEYWEASRKGYQVFIHSAVSGAIARNEHGTNWRQPNTSLTLPAHGERTYGFRFHWADGYQGVRDTLVAEGLIDVQVVPGMTVPSDLFARVALRTEEPIHSVEAEHPRATEVRRVGRKGEVHLYDVRFSKLGENLLTIRFGEGRRMVLEFFCTEPLETLYHKRAAFIARHRIHDPKLWFDGLLCEWAMDTHVQLSPDNYDRIKGWRIYEVSCDDPGLSKPAYLSSKNAEFPDQAQVDVLDYYVENFVWGGLQKTTEETFSYGIYGIPDWKTNRESKDPGRKGRQHLWRIYDYPHIVLMYYSLYRVARHHPEIRTALDAKAYLRRAYGTAMGMYTIPWEIERWSAYGTGCYNELVIPWVCDALETEGMQDEADRLRPHWERKVRTFVFGDVNLFQSEYAFDTTGFESTHALAKYALKIADPRGPEPPHEVRPGWVAYGPSTRVGLADAEAFMHHQMECNLFCRGWLETAYYLLGSDIRGGGGNSYTLTYMSQMGGWAVLDYGLHYAEHPAPYLRLGYASYLSSWALLNSGKPDSQYGYWYSGVEDDGGAGGGFEPAPFGTTWLGQPHHRGSWYYSSEIDLGFSGAVRGARTVLADDPLFGRFCYGGAWRRAGRAIEVIPKDGIRRRFHVMLEKGRLHLESKVDRFRPDRPIVVAEDVSAVHFELESDVTSAHTATLHVSGLAPGTYDVHHGATELSPVTIRNGEESVVQVPVAAGGRSEVIRFERR